MAEAKEDWTAAVGRIASGLFIVTAASHDKVDGYLGSWIQQASFEPLLVTVAIKPGRPCYDYIRQHGRFCINVVGRKNNGVMKPFWRGYDPSRNPFSDLDHFRSSRGNVVLKDCMAAVECQRVDSLHPGDHEILVARVTECHLLRKEDRPLTHVRKSGLAY